MHTPHRLLTKTGLILAMLLKTGTGLAQDEGSLSKTAPVASDTLLTTTVSWNGAPLPPYPSGTPEIHIMRYTIQPHTRMSVHRHTIINGGYMLAGTLTIVSETGEEKTFKAGDALVETTGTWHYGENRGDTPVVVVMFYAGADGIRLSEKKLPQP